MCVLRALLCAFHVDSPVWSSSSSCFVLAVIPCSELVSWWLFCSFSLRVVRRRERITLVTHTKVILLGPLSSQL